MSWSEAPKAGLFVIGLSIAALFSAPDAARAAMPDADALKQSDSSTTGAPLSPDVLQTLPADWAGSASGILTKDPVLKLAHCCHAHPVAPYDSHCCHPSTTVYVAPAYGVGVASVRGTARRTSRRTSRRVSRRR